MKRQKVRMIQDKFGLKRRLFSSKKKFEPVKLYIECKDDGIYFLNQEVNELYHIQYTEINYVNLSMCSRVGGIHYNSYQIDVDISIKDKMIYLEIFQPYSFNILLDFLNKNQVECIDMIGIIELYDKYRDVVKRTRYLDTHFNQIAKVYKLDHPRID